MPVVKVSPKFQVVIPREVRESLGLSPGVELDVFAYDGRIELVPVRSVRELRGILKGSGARIERGEDRV